MIFSLLTASSLTAASHTVVSDWGKVMADPDRQQVVNFLCESLHMSQEQFDQANLLFKQKRILGIDIDDLKFWREYAEEKGIGLDENWRERYLTVAKDCLNANASMYALVEELKAKGIPVALLSNTQERYAKLVRDFGLYDPFDPCILSSDIGVSKPDPKAYDILLEAVKRPGKEVVFFDDKLENIEAARKMDIDAILFVSYEQVRKDLIARGLLE